MPLKCGSPTASQQREAIVQALGHCLYAHRANTRCRQLKRQRDAVKPVTDLHDGRRVF